MTGVSERSQQRGNLKDNGYIHLIVFADIYTLWISRCIAAARERIPGSIDNYVTGVRECSQQRSNLKDDGYKLIMSLSLGFLLHYIFHNFCE
ncbi:MULTISPECIES: hypothetical protein [Photorhabdus]|uniref:hypothetical protein n=1 Tax=Photorhabdus TaxID=29487 RepID=UPI000D6DC4EB|nr:MULTISPECIES: hypothetical protein [Photorhabdus]NDK96603.1 hypothetical protein [Photorhabdus laumondii subsp. laumondii]NDL50385.1 hypothetical protein [Photorhabdus laumondii subsp. laumondii]